MLRVAVEALCLPGFQPRGKLDQVAAGDVVNGQLAFFFSENLVFAVPANDDSVPAQDGAFVRRRSARAVDRLR